MWVCLRAWCGPRPDAVPGKREGGLDGGCRGAQSPQGPFLRREGEGGADRGARGRRRGAWGHRWGSHGRGWGHGITDGGRGITDGDRGAADGAAGSPGAHRGLSSAGASASYRSCGCCMSTARGAPGGCWAPWSSSTARCVVGGHAGPQSSLGLSQPGRPTPTQGAGVPRWPGRWCAHVPSSWERRHSGRWKDGRLMWEKHQDAQKSEPVQTLSSPVKAGGASLHPFVRPIAASP